MGEQDVRRALSPVREWLEIRLAETPSDLAEAVHRLLAAAGGEPTPQRMADAAIDMFDRISTAPHDRAGALGLLAADALLTYAFEAAADPALGGSFEKAMRLAREAGPAGELGRRCAAS